MNTTTNNYKDLVDQAAERVRVVAHPATHTERREEGWRRFNVMLPPAVHRAFKVACIQDGIDMSDVAHSLIAAWLEERANRQAHLLAQ